MVIGNLQKKFISIKQLAGVQGPKELTKYGLQVFELTYDGIKYCIEKGYMTEMDWFEYINIYINIFSYNNKDQDKLNMNVKTLKNKVNELKNYTDPLSEKILLHEKRIKDFNNNIISIRTILIAAFSIIGFNIGGIKFIVESKNTLRLWEYVGYLVFKKRKGGKFESFHPFSTYS